MSSKRFVRQKQQAALRKLRGAGLYTGKIPRGELSNYQKSIVRKFDDVVKGRAAVLEPTSPREYKEIFRVKGSKVIVPRGKGERIKVNPQGNIERTRKGPRGEMIKGTLHRHKLGKPVPPPPPEKRYQYAIPFARKVAKNKYRLEWHRFPSLESLAKFMQEYEKERYPNWRNFVLKEEITDHPIAEKNQALQDAAIRHGMAKSHLEFENISELSPIMRIARSNRRQRKRSRHRHLQAGE